jgi:hypothetical protein
MRAGLPIIALLLVGCRTGADMDVNAIQEATEGLIYVGDAAGLPGGEVGDHGSARLVLPNRLVKGRQYIFHRKRGAVESWIAIEKSLRNSGADILGSPRGNVGLVYTTVGGPWFAIEFRVGRLRCSLQNRPAAELKSSGLSQDLEQQDFVLRIE